MKPIAYLVAALAVVPGALAVDRQKSAIVWFEDKSTPDHIVNQAKESIINAGGKITHVYTIIKGFAVNAPEKALQTVQAWGDDHGIKIEEDEMVSTEG